MDQAEIRKAAVAVLITIAPEADINELDADEPLRDQVDLDSMDWLNFLIGLHDHLHVDIPEADYAKLVTLNDLTSYVAARVAK